ncbi:MAG TPA: efflux RND transporter periplasmic adaptor subunit [Candidatus Polarisedimenticolaceae bacterium]
MNSRCAPFLLALPLAAAGCGSDVAAPTPILPIVELASVGAAADTEIVRAPGVVSRRLETPLAFRTGGIVASVRAREGDAVRRGQVLASLALDEIDARVAQARSALEKARRDLARVQSLQADRVATLEQVQDAGTGVEQAEAALRIAEFNRRHSVIEAPSDGVILRRLAEPGQEIGSGSAVLLFAAEAGGFVVRAGLSQADAARVRVGDGASVVFPGRSDAASGAIARIHEAADAATRTTTVEIELRSLPEGVRSGDVGTVLVRRSAGERRSSIPLSALVEGNGAEGWVFVHDEAASTVKRVAVRTAGLSGDRAILATPLDPGARIVVVGAEYLRDGSTVRVAGEASR